ncbi:hypothetical protein HK097_004715, partial [Rhizophlyctis rosea]
MTEASEPEPLSAADVAPYSATSQRPTTDNPQPIPTLPLPPPQQVPTNTSVLDQPTPLIPTFVKPFPSDPSSPTTPSPLKPKPSKRQGKAKDTPTKEPSKREVKQVEATPIYTDKSKPLPLHEALTQSRYIWSNHTFAKCPYEVPPSLSGTTSEGATFEDVGSGDMVIGPHIFGGVRFLKVLLPPEAEKVDERVGVGAVEKVKGAVGDGAE